MTSGREPRLLRLPYGNISGDSLRAAGELGYDVVGWSLQFHEDLYDAPGNAAYLAVVDDTVVAAAGDLCGVPAASPVWWTLHWKVRG